MYISRLQSALNLYKSNQNYRPVQLQLQQQFDEKLTVKLSSGFEFESKFRDSVVYLKMYIYATKYLFCNKKKKKKKK